MLEVVCVSAGRSAGVLTRRDVAFALLARPADEMVAGLPELRRELLAAGNPLSSAFWTSAESMLSSIRSGTATVGDVNEWLEATGSEPTRVFPDDLFVWPDESERGNVTVEMHGLLVAHLEAQVAEGAVDPDRLVTGDPEALASYREIQREWLRSPLPDGRIPRVAVTDEQDDEFLQAWDDADRNAREILGAVLTDLGPRPCPEADLRNTCARLRGDVDSDDPWCRLLVAAAGVVAADLPDDDRHLWLTLASGVVKQHDQAPDDVLDAESEAAWATLQHADWVAAAVLLARWGPGPVVDVSGLARDVVEFDFEAVDVELDPGEDEAWLEGDLDAEGDASLLSAGLFAPVQLWKVLGAIDQDDRLTELGWWGIPESVLHAWQPADEPI